MEVLKKNELRPGLFSGWHEFLSSQEPLGLTVAPLLQGAILTDPKIAVICESQLFGERVQQRRLRKRRQFDADAIVRLHTMLEEFRISLFAPELGTAMKVNAGLIGDALAEFEVS